MWKKLIWLDHSFAHAMTAELSWHVQSCDLIRSLELEQFFWDSVMSSECICEMSPSAAIAMLEWKWMGIYCVSYIRPDPLGYTAVQATKVYWTKIYTQLGWLFWNIFFLRSFYLIDNTIREWCLWILGQWYIKMNLICLHFHSLRKSPVHRLQPRKHIGSVNILYMIMFKIRRIKPNLSLVWQKPKSFCGDCILSLHFWVILSGLLEMVFRSWYVYQDCKFIHSNLVTNM